MVAATEAGGRGTVFTPKKTAMIKKKVNKIFAGLYIAAKIRRIDGLDYLKNKFNTIELTTCREGDFCYIISACFFEMSKVKSEFGCSPKVVT